MIRAKTVFPSTHPQHYTHQMRTTIKKLGSEWLERTAKLNLRDSGRDWKLTRTLGEYDRIFRPALIDFLGVKTFEELLIKRSRDKAAQGKRSTVNVREDGAGDGEALAQLGEIGRKNRVRVKTTASVLDAPQALCDKFVEGTISNLDIGPVELKPFKPKTDDVSISLWGGIHYTFDQLRRPLLLKHLYSLQNGAVALIGLDHRNPRNSWSIQGNLMHDHYGKGITAQQERDKIVAELRQRGFRAKFYRVRSKQTGFPNLLLAVQRLR